MNSSAYVTISAGAGGDSSTSQTDETRERVNYEVSQTEREITQGPGAVKRLTVAVLVNGTLTTAADGTEQFQPRSDEELAALRELVASAVGFDEARGDIITIKTMQFQAVTPQGTAVDAGFLDKVAIDVMSMIQAAVLAIVALILGLFVVRPLLSRSTETPIAQLAPPPVVETSADGDSTEMTALTGEIEDGDAIPRQMTLVQNQGHADTASGLPTLSDSSEDPVERLRALIGERQEETVEILRSWLEGEEESA